MLQPSDVDGPFLRRVKIASAHAKIAGRAHHAAGKTEGIVGKDSLGGAIKILVRDRRDEGFNVQLRGAGFLARCISAF